MALILALIVLCAAALGLALVGLVRQPEQRRLKRLAGGPGESGEGVLRRSELTLIERLVRPFAGESARRGEAQEEPLRRRLAHAGYRGESALVSYLGSRYALALVLPVLVLATPLGWSLNSLQLATALCCAAGLGMVLPSYWLDQRIKQRQTELMLALPDALDLMVVCVEAGLGINASLKRIAQDFGSTHPVLAGEFELTNLETRAGKSSTDALRGLAERTGVGEVSTLVAMLIQTERFGTGLADTLRVHADSMRVRRLQRAEEQANKAPLKMLFPTLFIFVAMLLIMLGPAMLAFSNVLGRAAR